MKFTNKPKTTLLHPFKISYKKLLLLLCVFINSVSNYAQETSSNNTLQVFIKICNEGYFDVIEKYTIDYDKESEDVKRFDFYLQIPTKQKYNEAEIGTTKQHFYISNIEGSGGTFEHSGKFKIAKENLLEIAFLKKQASDAKGIKTYELRYRVKNGFKKVGDSVALYWTLLEWTSFNRIHFSKINFDIEFPKGLRQVDNKQLSLFLDNRNNSKTSELTLLNFPVQTKDNHIIGQFSPDYLQKGIYASVIKISMPKDAVQRTYFLPPFWPNLYWVPLFIIFLIYFLYTFIRNRIHDYDPKKVVTVTSYYPPNDIDPVMAGLLIDDQLNHRDLTALMAKWAHEKIIKIENIKKGNRYAVKLFKVSALPDSATAYEKTFFQYIFKNDVVEEIDLMKNQGDKWHKFWLKTYEKILSSSKQLYDLDKWRKQVDDERTFFVSILSLGLTLLAIMFFFSIELGQWIGFVAMIILFLLMFRLGAGNIRKKTEVGKETLGQLRGFKNFIKVADVEKIKALIKEDPNYYESTHAYAAAFGLLKEWSRKFDFLK